MNSLLVCTRLAAPAARRVGISMFRTPKPWHRINIDSPATATTSSGIQSIYSKRYSTETVGEKVKSLRVLFFGSDEYDDRYLQGLINEKKSLNSAIRQLELVSIATKQVTNLAGHLVMWTPPVIGTAKADLVTTHLVETLSDSLHLRSPFLNGKTFDVGVVGNYSHPIPPEVAKKFPMGLLKIHNSLLPKYRGPSPVETAIMNGDNVTGVTICEYKTDKSDSGKILAQLPYYMGDTPTRAGVLSSLCKEGKGFLVMALRNLEYLFKEAVEQKEEEATYTEEINEDSARIYWEKTTAAEIERMSRAFLGKTYPNSNWVGKKMARKIYLTRVALPTKDQPPLDEKILTMEPGRLFFDDKASYLETVCIDRSRLILHKLRISLRKDNSGDKFKKAFLKGSGVHRLLTEPAVYGKPTRRFVYPPGTDPNEQLEASSSSSSSQPKDPQSPSPPVKDGDAEKQ